MRLLLPQPTADLIELVEERFVLQPLFLLDELEVLALARWRWPWPWLSMAVKW